MLHVAEDHESGRATPGCEVHQLPTHPFRAARHADPFFLKLLFESDVQVGHDEDVVRHEGGLVRHGLELHVRTKSRVCLMLARCGTGPMPPRRTSGRRPHDPRNSASTRPKLPATHRGSAPTARIASASTTIGRDSVFTTSRTASCVPDASPRPGPIATASARADNSAICRMSSRSSRWPTSGWTMNMGEYEATTAAASAGVAMWIKSPPTPRAPNPTSAGAPVYGPPAITSSRPF